MLRETLDRVMERTGEQLEVLEILVADPLVLKHLYVAPQMFTPKRQTAYDVGGARDLALKELMEKANSNPEFMVLWNVKNRIERLVESDYYFSMGPFTFLELLEKVEKRRIFTVWQKRIRKIAERLTLEKALSELDRLSDFFGPTTDLR